MKQFGNTFRVMSLLNGAESEMHQLDEISVVGESNPNKRGHASLTSLLETEKVLYSNQ